MTGEKDTTTYDSKSRVSKAAGGRQYLSTSPQYLG
jgi:hypothetical protein